MTGRRIMEARGQVEAPDGGTAPVVVGASPSCWAMIAASTTWRSEGSMAKGPPDTGTCQTCVIIGVGPLCDVPGLQGVKPSIWPVRSFVHRLVWACHCTRHP